MLVTASINHNNILTQVIYIHVISVSINKKTHLNWSHVHAKLLAFVLVVILFLVVCKLQLVFLLIIKTFSLSYIHSSYQYFALIIIIF